MSLNHCPKCGKRVGDVIHFCDVFNLEKPEIPEKKMTKKYIHELFNPTMETAGQVIKRATEFPQLRFEQAIYINSYEAVCIFSYVEKPVKIVTKKNE